MPKKDFSVSFGNCSGGLNSRDPGIALAENEVQYCMNAMFRSKGTNRAPGAKGISITPSFDSSMQGLFDYRLYDGTDYLIGVSGGKIYSVNKTTGAKGSVLYDLGTTTECWAALFLNKIWLCNANTNVKIESDLSVSQIGITAPAGASAAALAGGTLPAGNYIVYITYTRKVSGITRLYSEGQSLGTVTLGGGNGSIRISNFAFSADPQVTNKTVWLSDANIDTVYFYKDVTNNATTTVDVTSNSTRNTQLIYQVESQQNQIPGKLEFIYAFQNRLWGTINNVAYYSLKGNDISGSPIFDLERWPTLNAINYPYKIISIFGLNGDLYFNTVAGIFRQPKGDVTAQYVGPLTNGLYFKEPRTVKEFNSVVWGLTNDGFRYFDGNKFSIDLSKKIKPDIQRCYDATGDGFKPVGEIYRRSAVRTEYQLSFRDYTISGVLNNVTYVLNFDAVTIQDENVFTAPWEIWEGGFAYSCIDYSGIMYKAQSLAASGVVFKEPIAGGSSADQYIYNNKGEFLVDVYQKTIEVRSRIIMQYITSIFELQLLHVLAQLSKNGIVSIIIADKLLTSQDNSMISLVNNTGAAIYDSSLYDVDVYPSENPIITAAKLGQTLKGRSFYMKFTQTADDPTFNIQEIIISGIAESGRFI